MGMSSCMSFKQTTRSMPFHQGASCPDDSTYRYMCDREFSGNELRTGQHLWATAVPSLVRGLEARATAQALGRRPRPAGAHMQSHTLLGARHSFQSMAGGHRTLQAQAQVQLCCGR